MKTVAIVQARMSSSRLPGKVLADVAGQPMLARVCARVRQARRVDACVVATFDATLAARSPSEFVDEILVAELNARAVCVGYDFTFGKGRAGAMGP